MPEVLARIAGRIPPSIGRFLSYLPLGMGTALSMNYLVGVDKEKFNNLFSLVDKFVVLTQSAADIIAANGFSRNKTFVNRLGITGDTIIDKSSGRDFVAGKPLKIGYLGRFQEIKGVYDLARAAVSLPSDISFILEFRGPTITSAEKTCLNKLKSITGKDARITFAEAVPHEETFNVLRSYDVLVCPSACFEGGPTVALEAYAVGTPVIGTKIGGLAEIITDRISGRLVGPGDWRDLANVIKEISDNLPDTINYWRKNIPAVRTMKEIIADYLKIYNA